MREAAAASLAVGRLRPLARPKTQRLPRSRATWRRWRAQLTERTADVQRVHAEYANYRKRVERDREQVRDQATAVGAGRAARPCSTTSTEPKSTTNCRAVQVCRRRHRGDGEQTRLGEVRHGGRAVRPDRSRSTDPRRVDDSVTETTCVDGVPARLPVRRTRAATRPRRRCRPALASQERRLMRTRNILRTHETTNHDTEGGDP